MGGSTRKLPGLGIWVVRDELVSRERIDAVCELAQHLGATRLYLQVVGRADAFFSSSILPRSELLRDADADFDPLSYALGVLSGTGINVSAWVNVNFVWGFSGLPASPDHVIRKHPEWVTCDNDGRSMSEYTETNIEELFGIFLDPGLKDVRSFFSSIASEIASRYNVEELHFDYLRYPFRTFGYHPAVLESFSGWSKKRQKEGAPHDFDAFRRLLLTEEARMLHESAKHHGKNVSFAVYDKYEKRAFHERLQPWVSWLREGFPDYAVMMAYDDSVSEVLNSVMEVDEYLDGMSRVRVGLGAFKLLDHPLVLEQMILELLKLSPDEITLFSLKSLRDSEPLREVLRKRL